MALFLTSDEHYGHRNIIRYCGRPFRSVEVMDAELAARHNSVVSDGDEVWHLGDFCMDKRRVARYLRRLNGVHRLVCGNHDRCHPHRGDAAEWARRYLGAGFLSVELARWLEVDGLGTVLLTHMPRSEREDPRYQEYRPNSWAGWLFHGHVHERWLVRGRGVNVGVDQWGYRPTTVDQLVAAALAR